MAVADCCMISVAFLFCISWPSWYPFRKVKRGHLGRVVKFFSHVLIKSACICGVIAWYCFVGWFAARQKRKNGASSIVVVDSVVENHCGVRAGCWCRICTNIGMSGVWDADCPDDAIEDDPFISVISALTPLRLLLLCRFNVLPVFRSLLVLCHSRSDLGKEVTWSARSWAVRLFFELQYDLLLRQMDFSSPSIKTRFKTYSSETLYMVAAYSMTLRPIL